jgi:RNA-directed DNA polymerase
MDLVNQSLKAEFLKETENIPKFNALKLIDELELPEKLDESTYFKHIIRKRDGSERILFEPKPILKETQRQILSLVYSLKNHNTYHKKVKQTIDKYFPTDSSTAYGPGKNVVKNANYHIGQDVVLKMDVADFFNSINSSWFFTFWIDLLSLKKPYLIHLGIIKREWTDQLIEQKIKSLASKLISVTTLIGSLPQGAPSSGFLANIYLNSFDKCLLNFCRNRKLNYSRYSDDIAISGNLIDLNPGKIVHFTSLLLKQRGLKLKKSKTKILRQSNRQVVTGVVVNTKKSSGKDYKKSIRQHIYFLKKFGEEHISKVSNSKYKYLNELLGRLNWTLQLEPSLKEYKRYRGELIIIKRFVKEGKRVFDAVSYIDSLESYKEKINSNETISVCGVDWKIKDEKAPIKLNFNTFRRKNLELCLYEEKQIPTLLKKNPGWRLPTAEEFRSYFEQTKYDDRRLLGISYLCDPHFNGFVDEDGFRFYNRVGVYWTSDLTYLMDQNVSRNRIARKVICIHSNKWKHKKKFNDNHATTLTKNVEILLVNTSEKISRSDHFLFNEGKISDIYSNEACSIRLVKSNDATEQAKSVNLSNEFWHKVSSSAFSVDLSALDIHAPPVSLIHNWRSGSILLGRNSIEYFDLNNCAPVKRIDLRDNQLTNFELYQIPKSLKHLRLEGNSSLKNMDVPWNQILSSMHEFTHDDNQSKHAGFHCVSDIYLSAFGGERWFVVSSDEELDQLIESNSKIAFLKVEVVLGSDRIKLDSLFSRLSSLHIINLMIVFNPNDNTLKEILNQLKLKTENISNQLNKVKKHVKDKNWQINPDYDWFRKQHFIPVESFESLHLKALILDLSWLPNISFIGDFSLKPDFYHILHPGYDSAYLPATSCEFHRPNILIKLLGDKDRGLRKESMRVYYPLGRVTTASIHSKLHTILPSNQNYVDEIIIVMAGNKNRELRQGKIEEHFPLSFSIKNLNHIRRNNLSEKKFFKLNKRVSGFPLIGFSLHYDVHRLGLPLESIHKKDQILFNPSLLFKKLDASESIMDWREITLSDKIFTDNGVLLNYGNHLSELAIFSFKSEAEPIKRVQEKTRNSTLPYIVRKGLFAEKRNFSVNDRQNILERISSGDLSAKYLPSRFKKDDQIMLSAIKVNPFSMIFADRALKQNADFVLKALDISLKTLIFLPKRLILSSKKKSSTLSRVLEYLMEKLKPNEFYFIINKLARQISYSFENEKRFVLEPSSGTNFLDSFEEEVLFQDLNGRASMPTELKKYFLKEATNRGYLNGNGYYCCIEQALLNSDACEFLDLSFSGRYYDMSFLNNFQNLKELRLSFTAVNAKLPKLPKIEVLYVDGLRSFWTYNSPEHLCESTPNLKALYGRGSSFYGSNNLIYLVDNLKKLNKLDLRTINYSVQSPPEDVQQKLLDQGRIIEIKCDPFDISTLDSFDEELPF